MPFYTTIPVIADGPRHSSNDTASTSLLHAGTLVYPRIKLRPCHVTASINSFTNLPCKRIPNRRTITNSSMHICNDSVGHGSALYLRPVIIIIHGLTRLSLRELHRCLVAC